jgi:hypothetical protein
MRKVRNYKDFLKEELFSIFRKEEKKPANKVNKVDSCVKHILEFLKDNQIEDWNDFMSMTPFDREVIDKLIDSEVKTMTELKEVRFEIRLQLSDKPQLREMLEEYEGSEEYEKCAKILKKINNR